LQPHALPAMQANIQRRRDGICNYSAASGRSAHSSADFELLNERGLYMSYMMQNRKKSPLIYNIMNEVGSNFIANGLIGVGASPSISNMPEEADEMARNADAVVLNLGTLSRDRAEAMMTAGKAANEAGVPVLLDPIAIGATEFRTKVIQDILSTVKLAAICANVGEIAVLGDALDKTTSPDSSMNENDPTIAEKVANKYQT